MLDVDPAARLTLVNMHGRMDQIPPDDGVNQVLVSHRTLVAEIVPQPLMLRPSKPGRDETRDVPTDRFEKVKELRVREKETLVRQMIRVVTDDLATWACQFTHCLKS